jgi:transcriptional regulator with XRE-family HTH domain
MSTEFALDLRLARRKSGLTQRDTAHLLGVQSSRLSDLELGKKLPTLPEIITLSLIYGRSFESLFSALMTNARAAIKQRVTGLPEDSRTYVGTMNRAYSLERLEDRLVGNDDEHGGA